MDDAILTDKSGKVKALPCVLFAFFKCIGAPTPA